MVLAKQTKKKRKKKLQWYWWFLQKQFPNHVLHPKNTKTAVQFATQKANPFKIRKAKKTNFEKSKLPPGKRSHFLNSLPAKKFKKPKPKKKT